MGILPDRIDGEGMLLRCWRVDDAEAQAAALAESAEHLHPWMAFMSGPPLSITARREMLARWERERVAGGDALYGIFMDDAIAGGCGLHRRLGPAALEIGYWVHPSFGRRGVATEAVRPLTGAAFSQPGIAHVEIHHDKANTRSAGVPRKLGFRFVGEEPDEPDAPAEIGIECRWRLERPSVSP
jgi:ribosomal-protein-serine acetyltransferase